MQVWKSRRELKCQNVSVASEVQRTFSDPTDNLQAPPLSVLTLVSHRVYPALLTLLH